MQHGVPIQRVLAGRLHSNAFREAIQQRQQVRQAKGKARGERPPQAQGGEDTDEDDVPIPFHSEVQEWPNFPPPPDLNGANVRDWSPPALAFLGDSVWELHIRQRYFSPRKGINQYHNLAREASRAEAQSQCFHKLMDGTFATATEKQVLRWGRNASVRSAGVPKRFRDGTVKSHNVYRAASGLECLVGYLHLTDPQRLRAVMEHLGY
uniref:RNase III domain-containing protein n=1 Tax=Eutreptiella gymnastica TaxID=73025 RepID=A0A7S1NBA0_9EUGL|mmetsp:Transcript_145582/g.254129  ORF Transcript_145582/g.254129 Transcript_145582/m.254129 type:complete len:208 (+) Transcript_145582:3-626(+)